MTQRFSTAAKKVTELAKAIRDYWGTELPKRHPHYPIVDEGEDSGPAPPEEKKLRHLFARLPEDIVYKLAVVMRLGRGDFDTSDLPGDYQTLRENFDSPAAVAAQMMEKASLADYLEEGMTILKAQNIDLDSMGLTPAKAGR